MCGLLLRKLIKTIKKKALLITFLGPTLKKLGKSLRKKEPKEAFKRRRWRAGQGHAHNTTAGRMVTENYYETGCWDGRKNRTWHYLPAHHLVVRSRQRVNPRNMEKWEERLRRNIREKRGVLTATAKALVYSWVLNAIPHLQNRVR